MGAGQRASDMTVTQTEEEADVNSGGDLENRMLSFGLPELVTRHGVILTPNGYPWQSRAVLNGAPFEGLDGVIGLLSRTFGDDETCKWRREGTSCFGLATSQDGFHYEMASEEPAFRPEGDDEKHGVEDPRITFIDNKFYIPYTGVRRIKGSVDSLIARVCLASTTDFQNFERYGVILTGDKDKSNKDAALFPEKVDGTYLMLHRRGGRNIWLAYSDNLVDWYDHRIIMKPKFWWEKRKIGASIPPIKTEEGWLEIYHGVDENKVYRLGVALLDLEDPSIVIARYGPIFQAETSYERQGIVNNVVFPCGAIERNGSLIMPYGAGDRVTALASMNKNRLLNQTLENGLLNQTPGRVSVFV